MTTQTPDAALASLDPAALDRLAEREGDVAADPQRIGVLFPAAAREVGRTAGTSTDPGLPRVEDAVRVRLLDAYASAVADPDDRSREVHDLYRFGDSDERRAVLRALHRLDLGGRALDLVLDAVRTNDARLVAAALGPYGAQVLDDDSWRQGVLKCLFIGVPLDLVAGYPDRVDHTLVAMVAAYAAEREAAGRAVPTDARTILDSREA